MSETIVPLLDAATLQERVRALGAQISADSRGNPLVLVCVLKGSFIFAADLLRSITVPARIEFLAVRSYGDSTTTSGVVQIVHDLARPIEGEHLVVVEDIVDTGLTLAHLLELLRTRRPASLRVCTLLHKPARARVQVPIDYLGFTVEDRFLVGYGLDFAERHRGLPYVGVLENP